MLHRESGLLFQNLLHEGAQLVGGIGSGGAERGPGPGGGPPGGAGGPGTGGEPWLGLPRLPLKTQDIHLIAEMARKGTLTNIDLQIQDICNRPLPDLPLDATASNFGKADGNASPEDIASGIIHMVLQSIGQAAILSALNSPIRDFVLIGNLTQLPQCKEIFPKLEEMYGVRFLIPKYSEYRTAIGAALTYMDGAPIHPIK